MTWSQKRQLLYAGTIAAIIFLVVGWFVYDRFFQVQPTCFDGKQNGTEIGVDCGGSCARVCGGMSRSLVMLWVRPFEVAPGVYNVVAYFENQNVNAGVQQLQYQFKLYDAENTLVAEPFQGTTFVGPNQRTAILASGIRTGNRIPQTAFFTILQPPTWDTIDTAFASPLVVARNQLYQDLQVSAKVTAELVNTSIYDLQQIPVIAILYDADGNAFAAAQTLVQSLPQGSVSPITFTWQAPFAIPPARIEIIPRINPFLSHGR